MHMTANTFVPTSVVWLGVLLLWAELGRASSCACYQFPFGWLALLVLAGLPHMSEILTGTSGVCPTCLSSQGVLACETEEQETKWKPCTHISSFCSHHLCWCLIDQNKPRGWVQGLEVGIALLYSQEQRFRERQRVEAIFATCLLHEVDSYIVN